MARSRLNIPRDIIIVYVETIPTLTFTSWYPGQSRGSVDSSNQSDLSIDLCSQSDKTSDNIDISSLAESNINIDQYLVKDKHSTLESSSVGVLTHLDNNSDQESEVEYTTDFSSDMSSDSHWDSSHINPTKSQNITDVSCLDIVIEDYSSATLLGKLEETSDTDINHNTMKCIDLLDYGNLKSCKSWMDSPSETAKDKQQLEEVKTLSKTDDLKSTEIEFKISSADSKLSDPLLSDSLSPNDFEKLKIIATRLNLQTRRGSYTMWRNKLAQVMLDKKSQQQYDNSDVTEDIKTLSATSHQPSSNQSDEEKLRTKPQRISDTLAFIRSELVSN